MIRRSVIVKVVIFAVVTVLGVSYTAVKYVRIGDGLLNSSKTVYVDMDAAGGIFPNSEVTYRGVPVGRVTSVKARDNYSGVRMGLLINSGPEVPNDLDVVIANGSAIGEQYVDLQPRRRTGPYLKDGELIKDDKPTLPIETATLLMNLDQLVNSVPKDDLQTVISELGTAFAKTGPDLQRIIDASHALLTEASAALPQTIALLRDGRTVLDTQNDQASAIAEFAKHLASFTAQLRASDSDLRGALELGIPAAAQLTGLVDSVSATLPMLLGNLVNVGQVAALHVNDIKQVLIVYPYLVAASFTTFPGNGTTVFGVPMNQNGMPPACTQGYPPPSTQRVPEDTTQRTPYPYNAFCQAPGDSPDGTSVRGTRNAPGNRSNATINNTAVTTNNYRVASTGGQQRIMGDNSWQWLLAGPMGAGSD
ncbi:MAG: phospholipid/cholesterol/gamma-HCH transport system substrate-binding protein [Frankiales bacterium]|jgi:phospholipid/cholesterol/gamma-HCH transport system substrate-binding protein|nr:phospholipid/cholesterol/gamma-HCH transport system substrate-binding protein [Frankiales bacterium]